MTGRNLKHPGRWIWLLLLIPVLIGASRLRLDVEIFNLLPGDLPAVTGLRIHQQHFANARELIIVLRAGKAEDAEEAAAALGMTLRQQRDLVEEVIWQPPWLEQPQLAAELIAYLWFNHAGPGLSELAKRLRSDQLPTLLASAKEDLATSLSPGDIARLSYDPFGLTRLPPAASRSAPAFAEEQGFSSEDGTLRALFIKSATELNNYEQCADWLGKIKGIAERTLASRESVGVQYTGRPAFVSEISQQMRQDMTFSVIGTAAIIAVLFWIAHRRIKPLLWLLTLLALVLGSTLALGGLVFGTINVVSMGFAAILLGLAVDYAVVHYQEAVANPSLTVPQVRHAIAPSILWAAITTIAAFLSLNLGGLPGMAQLGTMVAIGVGLAALTMVLEFLPPLFPSRNKEVKAPSGSKDIHLEEQTSNPVASEKLQNPALQNIVVGISVILVLAASAFLVWRGMPRIDPTAGPLRPRNSEAYEALSMVQTIFGQKLEPLWVFVRGRNEADVSRRLLEVEQQLNLAIDQGLVASHTIPLALWPNPSAQAANRSAALELVSRRSEFHDAAGSMGFAPNSLALTDNILNVLETAGSTTNVFSPTNRMSRWILDKFAARGDTNLFALGMVTPVRTAQGWQAGLQTLNGPDVFLSGWELLGDSIYSRVRENATGVFGLMIVLVLISLWAAFRHWFEMALSLTVLMLSVLGLLCIMRLVDWSWNLLNVMAIPLVLGTGVDYSIFTLLALRRFGGNSRMAYRSVGRGLLLCGATAVAGFGALGLSSNAGMASLGQVCAVGIALNMLIAILLLPSWWCRGSDSFTTSTAPAGPSSFYRPGIWRVGMALAALPRALAVSLGRALMALYWRTARRRRDMVIANLLPVLSGDRPRAERAARKLFSNFITKVIDLLRYEANLPIDPVLGEPTGWDIFETAVLSKRGVLLVTPHLGNWEFGAPFSTRKGLDLHVITLAEPGEGFTELRQQARLRRKVNTLVIGSDPFAFVAVIRKLEQGSTVALLIDRPPAASAVPVKLFGREFSASIAAAELARASGCVILPVYVPLENRRYQAHVLPPIPYDRARLRQREARLELTQAIVTAFEPVIRKYADQWYHFVPLWRNDDPKPH